MVLESFTGAGLVGHSWSVYDPKTTKWRQTWVDDSGGYIVLEGGFADGKMTLVMLPQADQRPKRMVFSEIRRDSFHWEWQVQKLDGVWAPTFICEYEDRKSVV